MSDAAKTLDAYHEAEVLGCTRCVLHETRTQVVPGSGDPDADIMFVGEAPGYHEDRNGVPFVGQAGKLLDELLAGIGLTRENVFVANVLKCRPPGNRDPRPEEIASCEPHLYRQVAIVRPKMICTLGNFATKLLSGRQVGISRVHGQELAMRVGELDTLLYPLLHPAAALYTPSMKALLQEDFARIPSLIGAARSGGPTSSQPAPEQPEVHAAGTGSSGASPPASPPPASEAEQLGLF